jgi:hypothetical protein
MSNEPLTGFALLVETKMQKFHNWYFDTILQQYSVKQKTIFLDIFFQGMSFFTFLALCLLLK